jgi:hypothetical protein
MTSLCPQLGSLVKKNLLLIMVYGLSVSLQAQPERRKPSLIITLDGRFSFIRDQKVDIQGIKLGLGWRKWRAGIGFYGLLKPQEYTSTVTRRIRGQLVTQTFSAKLSLWYGALFAEYVLVHSDRWEISLPIQIGYGRTQIRAFLPNGTEFTGNNGSNTQDIFLIEPSLTGYYKILSWIGPGVGIGYRQTLYAEDRINKNFNNPIYILKAKLFLGDFIDVVRGKKPVWK